MNCHRLTSRDALRSADHATHRRLVLRALTLSALTHEELAYVLRGAATAESVRGRCAELVAEGLVRDSGRRKKKSTGRQTIVWEAIP